MKEKTINLIGRVFLLTGLALLFSCEKEADHAEWAGGGIVFRASSEYDNGPETKTSYSGVEYGGKERIDWVNGDKIRILSDKARHPGGASWSDYQVTGVTPGTGSAQPISYASIKNVGDNGLHWGSGTHNFYAVYPSPATNSDISINNNVINLALPKSQLQAAQMDYAYMFAAVQTAEKATVNLSFKPMFTAFQFQVRSDEEASMTITSFSLSTGENKAMTGSCRATITAAANSTASTAVYSNFTAYNASSGNNTITVDMGAGVTVTPSSYATITVFALPQDYSQLTASFTTSTGETKSLKLQQADGTWVNFTACHKYNINGLGLPGGGWTYTASDIADIIRTGEEVIHYYTEDVTVTVQRSRTNGTTEGVPWKAYFTAASDPTAVVGASAVGQSWSEVPLQDANGNDWLSLSAYSGNGNHNRVKVALEAQVRTHTAIDLMVDAQAMTTAMNANNLGTIDVSQLKFDGSTYAYRSSNPANTANCYVINGYGTFYIPLVYGNGIQNGLTSNAYIGISGDNNLATFVNADGLPITSDFILSDANLTKSGDYKVHILWQDVDRGFQIIDESSLAFVPLGSPELTNVAAVNCDYLKFTVPQYQSEVNGYGIKPGNALIALYDKSEDKFLWKWHIWFTNQVFSTGRFYYSQNDSEAILEQPLGWTPPISYRASYAPARKQRVLIVDQLNNIVVDTFLVSEDYISFPDYLSKYYSATSYAWGFPQPVIPRTGYEQISGSAAYKSTAYRKSSSTYYHPISKYVENFTETAGFYDAPESYQRYFPLGQNNAPDILFMTPVDALAFYLRYPIVQVFIASGNFTKLIPGQNPWSGNSYSVWWPNQYIGNLWRNNGEYTKTIYDPSPAGFKVMKSFDTSFRATSVSNPTPYTHEFIDGSGEVPPHILFHSQYGGSFYVHSIHTSWDEHWYFKTFTDYKRPNFYAYKPGRHIATSDNTYFNYTLRDPLTTRRQGSDEGSSLGEISRQPVYCMQMP